jgi:hypothetical protein
MMMMPRPLHAALPLGRPLVALMGSENILVWNMRGLDAAMQWDNVRALVVQPLWFVSKKRNLYNP